MRKLSLEYSGQRQEVDRWPPEYRCLLKLAKYLFPQVQPALLVDAQGQAVKCTDDLRRLYAAAETTGLVTLSLYGEELSSPVSDLPPPGFCLLACKGLPCYKCDGNAKHCKRCHGKGILDIKSLPKYASLVTFVRREVSHWLTEQPTKVPKNRQCDPDIRLCCRFVRDVVCREGEVVSAGSVFRKVWRVRNTGKTSWPAGCQMVFVNGDFEGEAANLPCITPDSDCDVEVRCRAPSREGEYYSLWRACDHTGMRFGHRLGIKIRVEKPSAPLKLYGRLETEPEATLEALRRTEGDVEAALALLEVQHK